jgi:NAD(P)-dependent dehydrogenase (short-subunit alcohol dehydrogenase family)
MGVPISLRHGNPLQSENLHGQAQRQDRSHQRRHQRYRCEDCQTLSIRRRDGGRYRLQRALGGSRQGGAARIEVLVWDAGNVVATKDLVDQVKAKHGRIDVLFVNAGIAKFAPIAQVDEAFYDSPYGIHACYCGMEPIGPSKPLRTTGAHRRVVRCKFTAKPEKIESSIDLPDEVIHG